MNDVTIPGLIVPLEARVDKLEKALKRASQSQIKFARDMERRTRQSSDRPPAPKGNVAMEQRPMMHQQSNRITRWGHATAMHWPNRQTFLNRTTTVRNSKAGYHTMSTSKSDLKGSRAAYLTNLVLHRTIRGALILPYATRVRLMGWLVCCVIAPIAGYRRRIRENLAHTCPNLPKAEVFRLCRAVPDNVGRTLIEIYSGPEFVARAIAAPIEGPGLAQLEAARAEGRPVILVTGHIGNYDVVRANLIHRGYNMGALYRRMSNPYFNDHYVRSISRIGTPLFERGRKGMFEMVRHIRTGGILGILTDLHVKNGETLTFFGQKARTSLITAELALKFNAALIPIYGLRNPDGISFRIVAQREIPHSNPVAMTQAVNDGLEVLVRENMDQWLWIHRRWK